MYSPKRYSLLPRLTFPLGRALIRRQLRQAGGRKIWQRPPLIINGLQSFPDGGVLILANHQSDVDPPIIQYCLKRGVHFMGKANLFEMKIWGPVIRFYHAFPLNKDRVDRKALKHAIELLQLGEVVCVFPEGSITPGDAIYPLERGISLIIRESNPTVICAGLTGTREYFSGGSLELRKADREVHIRWGAPFRFSEDATSEEIIHRVTHELCALTGLPLSDSKLSE